jgi:radical SAM family uncharacterized protein/radical SAM-linked protein
MKMMRRQLGNILRQVEKPGRYIGGEWNVICKNPARTGLKIALAFPDVYEIGMSYLGQKILYSVLNEQPDVLAERVFAPWPDMEEKLRSAGVPIFSLENKIPLREFDIIGFSLLYELNYTNILTILDLAGIPFFAAARDRDFPMVIAGGPACFNPEPVSDIFDAVFLGDGEDGFLEIAVKVGELRKNRASRVEILRALAGIPGVYVPRFYDLDRPSGPGLMARRPGRGVPWPVKKRTLASLNGRTFPEKIIVPDIQAVFDRVAVEVARGCPQRCRFCQAASIYFPFRTMDSTSVVSTVRKSLDSTGYEDVSLSALSISDYPGLEEMVDGLTNDLSPRKVSLSLPSLRPFGLSSAIAEGILRVRKTGFTLVPEAGSDRLRAVINKSLNNREILAAAANAFGRGWRLLKLYFMIGLPTETHDDLRGIVDLVGEIVRLGRDILKAPPRLNISLSSFIPKPHTPFQWLAMEEENALLEKQQFLRSALRRYPSIKVKDHPTRVSVLEGVFSRGDRRLGPVLVQAWRRGARFDSWKDRFAFSAWQDAFSAEGLDYHAYLGPLDPERPLPWDHIDPGIKRDHLLAELNKARRGEPTPSCLEMSCLECNGCDPGLRLKTRAAVPRRTKLRRKPEFGEKTSRLLRYEMVYAKAGTARYLSHRDLTNQLSRAFRRAGIETSFSGGFHPKMSFSYCPALALGMEGKEEILEFRAARDYEPGRFIRRLNRLVRSGIKIISLRSLRDEEPPLSWRITGALFSISLRDREVKEALQRRKGERGGAGLNDRSFLEKEIAAVLTAAQEPLVRFWVDRKRRRLLLSMPQRSGGGIRPQDIIASVLGLTHPSFHLTREGFIFAGESEGK